MSKISRMVKPHNTPNKDAVINYMGGISYNINPIDTLKMVTASSIFSEPQYYRKGEAVKDGEFKISDIFSEYSVISDEYEGKNTSEVMEKIIDKALDYDFKSTIEWARVLRNDFNMRLNPQVIMVKASIHPNRVKFTEENPGLFNEINDNVMRRADEPASQLAYYLYMNGKKNNVPAILKRSWSKKLSNLSSYQLNKYKNTGIGMIDTIRVCHAHSKEIDELMKTGSIVISDEDQKWESLRSQGMSWERILNTISIPHMALLRNLRGIFSEISDKDTCVKLMEQLKKGVITGKQFPFRYHSAMQAIKNSDVYNKQMILDTLEECIDISCDNMPKLHGKTMCLSDNSGSAWSSFPSEYGKVTVATIGNLSSLITAHNSDEGYVGLFGDKLISIPVSKRNGLLTQLNEINKEGNKVGQATENGIWLFFKQAIEKKEHWDNIVIYSDMQAGHGGLYGIGKEYADLGFEVDGGTYIDVLKLIKEYRKINPKVNVYCIQTAGYTNTLVPEYGYRNNNFYGWTGKELLFIDAMNKFWDEKDTANTKKENV